jgi:hypothetical protein|tara:strand:- start:8609 stop:9022 length:414 start_codon:yes stop_codon:yes gene_type:complete
MFIDEAELSRNLGIDRRTLKGLREELLVEGEDYVRGRYRKIQISLAGQSKIKAKLFPEKYMPEKLSSEERVGYVTNNRFRNQRLVEVDGKYLVTVKNAKNYSPNLWGQPCECVYKEMGGRLVAIRPPNKNWARTRRQ